MPGTRLRKWARRLKRDVVALWIAARDARTPLLAKILAGAVAAYALSPIDLIPDFIPIVGLLDDVIIVPAGIWLTVRLIEPSLIDEFRRMAMARERPTSWLAAFLIFAIWIAAILLLWSILR